jgi:hypothetical protein
VPEDERLERYKLLASAIAGRLVEVAPGDEGAPAWTDGATIRVAPDLEHIDLLRSIVVQASLLAAGSLVPEIVARLDHRGALQRRYLAIEGHRALASQGDLLPESARSLLDPLIAARTSSADESLRIAFDKTVVAEPPFTFGAIRTRALRANLTGPEGTTTAHVAAGEPDERDDRGFEEAIGGEGPVLELSSAWVGRGGAIGRLLKRLLADARIGGSGAPGADARTHWSRNPRGTPSDAAFTTTAPARLAHGEGSVRQRSNTYPEWDDRRGCYRDDWCTVEEVEVGPAEGAVHRLIESRSLRRPLARVGLGLVRQHRQLQGDDVDIDAAVEAFVAQSAESAPDDACYIDTARRARDLAVLVLLDVSGSAAEPSAIGGTVHAQQRAVAGSLTAALHDLGDRVALYAFRSLGRTAVHVLPVKRFDDRLDAGVTARLGALTPGAYTRLGAAIRHGAVILESQGGAEHRVLVVVSDGFAYDHGYEGAYGEADARHALAEARRRGIGCLCLSVGAGTEPDTLRRVFGTAAHASLPRAELLAPVVGPLFREALRTAESQQRTWQRTERARHRRIEERRSA